VATACKVHHHHQQQHHHFISSKTKDAAIQTKDMDVEQDTKLR